MQNKINSLASDTILYDYPTLDHFVVKHNYQLIDFITYNSYRTGKRSEVRDFDSISVTEVLSVIRDPTIDFLTRFHEDKLKEAQDYGTRAHKGIENYINKVQPQDFNSGPNDIDIQFKLFLIKNKVELHQSEVHFEKSFGSLPLVTGMVDAIGYINGILHLIDWKVSKKERNFKSVKYHLQAAGYRWLSGIDKSVIVYLNQKGYSLSYSKDMEYYDKVWLELLSYTNYLYETGAKENLYTS